MAGGRQAVRDLRQGATITINVNDATSKKLADYWGGLVKEGVVSRRAGLHRPVVPRRSTRASTPPGSPRPGARSSSPAQRQGHQRASGGPRRCRSGTRASTQSRQLGRLDVGGHQGDEEPDRGGEVRRVPQHRPRRREDVRDPAVPLPGDEGAARRPDLRRQKPDFYGGQKVNEVFAEISGTVSTPTFQWPPFLDQACNDWNETVGKSLADKTDTVAALDQWQDADHHVRQEPGLHRQ